jgi:hypothetical protein
MKTKNGRNEERGDRSKRDSSTAYADSFAGAKEKKKRRLTSVGMTMLWLAAES